MNPTNLPDCEVPSLYRGTVVNRADAAERVLRDHLCGDRPAEVPATTDDDASADR